MTLVCCWWLHKFFNLRELPLDGYASFFASCVRNVFNVWSLRATTIDFTLRPELQAEWGLGGGWKTRRWGCSSWLFQNDAFWLPLLRRLTVGDNFGRRTVVLFLSAMCLHYQYLLKAVLETHFIRPQSSVETTQPYAIVWRPTFEKLYAI
jgi:hypothetical protein